jgi:acetyl esterase/lipase
MTSRDYMGVTPPPGLRIPYGTDREQFGDLRIPVGAGPHPVVVVAHGGWWRSAFDLTYAGHMCEALTADGYATWNIEYRRVGQPGGGYPGTLHDVTAALGALRSLATGYDLDLSRIVVTGHSAGGHIAAWLAAKGTRPELNAFGSAPRIVGAVPVAGVLDLDRTSELRVESDGAVPVHDFLGATYDEAPATYAIASPARLLPTGVPVIVIHGDADANVPLELSQRYVERARAAGDPAELVVLPGVDHFEPFDPGTPAGARVRAAIRTLIERAAAG